MTSKAEELEFRKNGYKAFREDDIEAAARGDMFMEAISDMSQKELDGALNNIHIRKAIHSRPLRAGEVYSNNIVSLTVVNVYPGGSYCCVTFEGVVLNITHEEALEDFGISDLCTTAVTQTEFLKTVLEPISGLTD